MKAAKTVLKAEEACVRASENNYFRDLHKNKPVSILYRVWIELS